jgi:hypothetical protein
MSLPPVILLTCLPYHALFLVLGVPLQVETGTDMILHQSEEQIAREFNGTVKRLPARSAFAVYCKAGGLLFGIFSVYIFMAAQTCRIYSDLLIRWVSRASHTHFPCLLI